MPRQRKENHKSKQEQIIRLWPLLLVRPSATRSKPLKMGSNLSKYKKKGDRRERGSQDPPEYEANPSRPIPNLHQMHGGIGDRNTSEQNNDSTFTQAENLRQEASPAISQAVTERGSEVELLATQTQNPSTCNNNTVPGSASAQRSGSEAEGGSTVAQQGSEAPVPQNEQPNVEHAEFSNRGNARPGSSAVDQSNPSYTHSESMGQPDLSGNAPDATSGCRRVKSSRWSRRRSSLFNTFRRRSKNPASTTDETTSSADVDCSQTPHDHKGKEIATSTNDGETPAAASGR